jgi:hypothetical protein
MGISSKRYKDTVRPQDPFVQYDKNRDPLSVLIIGNGFDLDLGMHTTYSDFAKSNFWPFKTPKRDSGLGKYLNTIRKTERWLDLENELARYARYVKSSKPLDENTINKDKQDLNDLIASLRRYLHSEEIKLNDTGETCKAKDILNSLVNRHNYFVHSFNYTGIYYIAQKLNIRLEKNRIEYIHGTLEHNDLILGAGDNTLLPDEYDWLYKTSNRNYSSNNLAESLNYAQEITIFGHSLGDNDFDYFKPFFQKISQNVGVNFNHLTNERLKLTIYTRDEESEIEIKRQLRKLTDNHLQGIYANCDFEVKYTKQ